MSWEASIERAASVTVNHSSLLLHPSSPSYTPFSRLPCLSDLYRNINIATFKLQLVCSQFHQTAAYDDDAVRARQPASTGCNAGTAASACATIVFVLCCSFSRKTGGTSMGLNTPSGA